MPRSKFDYPLDEHYLKIFTTAGAPDDNTGEAPIGRRKRS